jgi:hypothetical protein
MRKSTLNMIILTNSINTVVRNTVAVVNWVNALWPLKPTNQNGKQRVMPVHLMTPRRDLISDF